VNTDRRHVGAAIVLLASGTVLFAAAFLAAEGWLRWLLLAIFGFPGAFAFWLGTEPFRRQWPARGNDDGADNVN
jgi:hypothetical protein